LIKLKKDKIVADVDLSNEEQEAIADIISGTMDSMLQDVDWDHEDVSFWMTILQKLGKRGNIYVAQYEEARTQDMNS
jgi:hypothetical protein